MAALVVALPRIIIDLPIFTLIHGSGDLWSMVAINNAVNERVNKISYTVVYIG